MLKHFKCFYPFSIAFQILNIPELNFFDNMKHIQKHRRGRALTRLAAKLDEFDDTNFDTFLNIKTCFVVIYPLACSYLFNTEYIKFSDTIQV